MIVNDNVNFPIDKQYRQHYSQYPQFYKLLNDSLMDLRLYMEEYTYKPVYADEATEYNDKTLALHKLMTDEMYLNIVYTVMSDAMESMDYPAPITQDFNKPEAIIMKYHKPIYFNQLDRILTLNDMHVQQKIKEYVNAKIWRKPLQFASDLAHERVYRDEYKERQHTNYFGHKTFAEWYNIYEQAYTKKHQPITYAKQQQTQQRTQQRTQRTGKRDEFKDAHRVYQLGVTIAYPFKSKVDRYIADNDLDESFKQVEQFTNPTIPNRNKLCKTLMRPYYSPKPGCWEIDHVFNLCKQGDSWMFCINVNTRYLVVYEIPERANDVLTCLQDLMTRVGKITEIKGDGSSSYVANPLRAFYDKYKINVRFNDNKFTYHNKIVDSVVRTIRDAIGYQLISGEQLQELVIYYNTTYHRIIKMTPEEMQFNEHKEWAYIRHCDEKLVNVKRNQEFYGLYDYTPGNILLLRVDLSKTSGKHEKNRKYFNRIGKFKNYDYGNVCVRLYNPILIGNNEVYDITLPIFYAKKIADDEASIPTIIKNKFFIRHMVA